jgi:hypothetical protein
VERRQRPRLVQQRVAVQRFNQRLETLEQQLGGANKAFQPSDSITPARQETARSNASVPSPEASLTVADGQQCKDSPMMMVREFTRINAVNHKLYLVTPKD